MVKIEQVTFNVKYYSVGDDKVSITETFPETGAVSVAGRVAQVYVREEFSNVQDAEQYVEDLMDKAATLAQLQREADTMYAGIVEATKPKPAAPKPDSADDDDDAPSDDSDDDAPGDDGPDVVDAPARPRGD